MTELTDKLKATIDETTKALVNVLHTAGGGDIETEDTAALEGTTKALLTKSVEDRLAAHLKKSNPHNTTLDKLDAYSKDEIMAKTGSGVPSGTIPVSFYGIFDNDAIAYTTTGLDITIPAVGCFIQGTSFDIPATTLRLSANQTKLKIYIRYVNGIISYHASSVYEPETPTSMYVGGFRQVPTPSKQD